MPHHRGWVKGIALGAFFILFFGVLELDAWARAGGGRSFGGGSSRSFSTPYRSFGGSGLGSQSRAYEAPRQPLGSTAPAGQAWGGGGFLRGLAGGLAGGFLGSLLFSSLGYASGLGGFQPGFGGFGFLEMLLVAGAVYMVFAYLRRRSQPATAGAATGLLGLASGGSGCCGSSGHPGSVGLEESADAALRRGITEVQAVVPGFDPLRFPEEAMDIFSYIERAWTSRDLQWVSGFLTPEARQELQRDLDVLKAERRINQLENIAIRRAEIREAWVESGKPFVTVHVLANLLDDTVEEGSGRVVAGSREVPVKFEEYWTFTRAGSEPSWRLSAIQQAE
jgi:predicted lipid-binding transport protein (Tim44 family)